MKSRKKSSPWKIAAVLFIVFFVVYFLFPIYWTFTTSIKERSQIFQQPPAWFPTQITFQHYADIFNNTDVGIYFRNSLFVGIITVLGTIGLALPAAFGLSVFRYKGRTLISNGIITIRMIPGLLFTIPYYVIFLKVGLTDTLIGIALCHIAINLPFAIWLFINYFKEIPSTIYEAALIDGCNNFNLFTKIAMKLVRPGLVTVAILVFMNSWNEFSIALTMVFSDNKKTLPIAISSMIQYNTDIPYGTLSAIGMIAMIPAILLSIFAQRYIISGMTAGAVKE